MLKNTNIYKETLLIKNIRKIGNQMGKCVYCKGNVDEGSALDVCEKCGVKVWGLKMFKAIQGNMAASRERGDLEQGNVH